MSKSIKMEMVNGVKTIYLGEVNDSTVYATSDFAPLEEKDLEYTSPEFIIKCDGGVSPIANFEQYICNEAERWFFNN